MKDAQEIINAIREYPELYARNHANFKNFSKRQLAWKRVQAKTGVDVYALKVRWKNLRDTYKKYKQAQQKLSKEAAKKYTKWIWADEMSFLDHDYTKSSSEINSETVTPEVWKIDIRDSEHTDESLEPQTEFLEMYTTEENEEEVEEEEEEAIESKITFPPQERATYHSKKRRISDASNTRIVYRKTSITSNTEGNLVNVPCDRLDMTFLGYADTVKKLSLKNQALIKLKFAKLITDHQLQELGDS